LGGSFWGEVFVLDPEFGVECVVVGISKHELGADVFEEPGDVFRVIWFGQWLLNYEFKSQAKEGPQIRWWLFGGTEVVVCEVVYGVAEVFVCGHLSKCESCPCRWWLLGVGTESVHGDTIFSCLDPSCEYRGVDLCRLLFF
jgi:hypothetical protein